MREEKFGRGRVIGRWLDGLNGRGGRLVNRKSGGGPPQYRTLSRGRGPFRAGMMAVSGGASRKDLTVREDGFFIMGGAAATALPGLRPPSSRLAPPGEGEWFGRWCGMNGGGGRMFTR